MGIQAVRYSLILQKESRRADMLFSIICWISLLVLIYCWEVAFIRLAGACGLFPKIVL